ncbi:uncharacterized protein SCHCODRAFT_01191142 [Schizophyllum commune H4-8]|uniref:uncharacterized protein n=1 Tax=Schizophyllum commune (strain H4-8 / FGSC 9210) TaxID=578458 RepID=UPI0021610A9B|nr:uncharacterized protein SCHCODRAFT_01191142 [Schizophyllum commune H4-8]KAI5890593.1 hypothetical protein SCHCODRAFT_01191142 [Schizophyllum commune H4-8]
MEGTSTNHNGRTSEKGVLRSDEQGQKKGSPDAPSAGDGGEDEIPIENPSTDIRGDLAQALDQDLSNCFKGDFAFCRTYQDAPNPGLFLPNDVGVIGLPLNPREAPAIVASCQRQPALTIQRETGVEWLQQPWELPGSEIGLIYPAWGQFTQRVLHDVCTALGIDTAVTKPRCKLRELLLCEPGSVLLPTRPTDTPDGLFATITILLPSPFTGGALDLTHGLLSKAYDLAASSWHTTAVAWYAEVQPSLTPVASGYAFALSYNVFHGADAPRPVLPDNQTSIESLRRILLSWKQANSPAVPRKLVYLLDETYPSDGLGGGVLRGLNKQKVFALRALATQHGFCLGLANADVWLVGEADDEGPPRRKRSPSPLRPWRVYAPEEEYYTDQDSDDGGGRPVDFVRVDEVEMEVRKLVDLDGNLLKDEVALGKGELEKCTIPTDLEDAVQSGDHEDEEYSGFHHQAPGTLTRRYERTVLVIWPQEFDLDKTFEKDIEEAISTLDGTTSARPSQRERKLVDFLFNAIKARYAGWTQQIARTIFSLACRWTDQALWMRVVKSATRVAVLGQQRGAVEACADETIRSDATLPLWLAEQRTWALGHLTTVSKEDIPALVSIVKGANGVTLLRESLAPQLKAYAEAEALLSFVLCFPREEIEKFRAEERPALVSTVADLLGFAVSKADFYAPAKSEGASNAREPAPDTAIAYIDACLQTGNEALVADVVSRLTDLSGLSSADKHLRTTKVLLPLLSLVGEKVGARPAGAPVVPGISELCDCTVKLFLSDLSAENLPSKADVRALVQASVVHGGTDLLVYTIWPALSALPYREETIVEFIQAVHDNKAKIPVADGAPTADTLQAQALQLVIDNTPFTAYTQVIKPSSSKQTAPNPAQDNQNRAIALLKLCLSTSQKALCTSVFARLFDEALVTPEYVQNVLVPFIPQLRQFLINNKKPPFTEPFGAVFAEIVCLWAKHVLGPKPAETATLALPGPRKHSCHCQFCEDLFKFLEKSEGKAHRFERIGAPKRKHLESELGKFARGIAQWSVINSSPQGLLVTKADAAYEPLRWRAVRAKGEAILQSVSQNRVELQRIFGARYQSIMDMFYGGEERAEQPPQASSSSQPSSSRPPNSQPARPQPAWSQPARTQPAWSQPARPQVASTQPPRQQPAWSQTSSSQPSGSQPSYSQPSTSRPPTSQPENSQPSAFHPFTSQQSTSQQSTSQQSQPPTSQPPTSQPSGSQLPSSQPAHSQPAHSQPAHSQLPSSQPSQPAPSAQDDDIEIISTPPRRPFGSATQPNVTPTASAPTPPLASQSTRKRKAAQITGDVIDLTRDRVHHDHVAIGPVATYTGRPSFTHVLNRDSLLNSPIISAYLIAVMSSPQVLLNPPEDSHNDVAASDDVEEDEEIPVANPSTDILYDLSNALNENLSECFKGAFSFCRTYKDAPNPGLLLGNDIGVVGLPLSSRDAAAIKAGCQRDLPKYVQNVDESCLSWTLTGGAKLSKERSEATFATLTILLPSHFTGGSIRFTHGYLSETHKPHHSSWHTTALATYTTDQTSTTATATATVHPSAKPITSGHALALHYDLVHTADTPCPVLPDNRGPIERIRHVLRSWKQALTSPSVPRKVVHLLDGSYPAQKLSASALKGLDGQKIEALRMLVKDEGLRRGKGDAPRIAHEPAFNLALATLKVKLTGMASDPGPKKKFYDPMHPWRTYDANGSDSEFDDDDWEERDIDFADIDLAEFSVERLVDLNGKLIKDKFEVYEEDLDEYSIPSSLREVVQEGDFVKQEYGGWQWDEQKPGWLERHYERTVLLIWPEAFDLDKTVEDDIDDALKELNASSLERPDASASQALQPQTPNRPHPRERNRIDFLFNVAQEGPHHRLRDVARCLFAMATGRRDLSMWLRVTDECAPNAAGEAMDYALVRDAVRAFGVEALYTAFETMVRSLETNAPRFNILKYLHDVSMEEDLSAEKPQLSWVAEQRQWALDHLVPPSHEDVPVLAGFVGGPDGLRILHHRRLKPVASADFMRSFAVAIWSEAAKIPDEAAKLVLASIITDLLSVAISKADFLEHKQPEPPRPFGVIAPPEPNLQAPCALICACVQTGNESLADGIVKRLLDLSKVERCHRQGIVKNFLLPLVSLVGAQLDGHLIRTKPVQRLYQATVDLFLSHIPATPGLSKADVESLVKAGAFQGGAAFLADIVWPSLCALEDRGSIILDFVQALHEHRDGIPVADGAPTIDAVITLALQRIIDNSRCEPYSHTQYPGYYGYSNASQRNQDLTLYLFKLCITYGQIPLCSSVFAQLCDRTLITPAYIQNVLVPFLPQLRHFLDQNKLPAHTPPFNAAFTEIVALWATHVLGPRPPDPPADMIEKMSKPSCHCQSCVDVFTFLNKSTDRVCRFERLGAPKRQHLEQGLSALARGAATWQVIGGSSQGLLVTKTDAVYKPVRWKALHAQAGAILRSISSNEAELRLIFGPRYQAIVDMLHGMFCDTRGQIPSESTQPSAASAGVAPLASASNTAQSAPSALPESRKRKAEHLTGDVIDLTHMEC